MAASIALRMTSLLVAVNSLLGIRSTIPTLLPVVLCLPVKRWTRVALTGVALGLALVMGTEQGLAALAGARHRDGDRSRFAAARASRYVVDAVADDRDRRRDARRRARDHRRRRRACARAIAYNFKLVPMDQYWYFGSPPNLFLGSWRSMPAMLATIPRIPLTHPRRASSRSCSARDGSCAAANEPAERERFAFTVLALYGLISCASLLGTYVHAYVQPLLRVLLLLGAVALDRHSPVARRAARPRAAVRRQPVDGRTSRRLALLSHDRHRAVDADHARASRFRTS